MVVEPCELWEASEFIAAKHRHHRPPQGHRFSMRLMDGEVVRGVIVVGRTVARHQHDRYSAEVTRLCTDGTPNACSMLLGAARRALKAMGYKRLISYTLDSEPGSAWRASGFQQLGLTDGGAWSGTYGGGKERKNTHPLSAKKRWELAL